MAGTSFFVFSNGLPAEELTESKNELGPPADKPSPSRKEIRAKREAEALRENLRRRKEQTRARETADKDDPKPS